MPRFTGATVQVELRERDERDALGNDVEAYAEPVSVSPVLIQRGECRALDASRPEGAAVTCTLHFPKTWAGDLRGARVTLPPPWDWGNPYRVVGEPMPEMPDNCPWLVEYDMPVEVSATDG